MISAANSISIYKPINRAAKAAILQAEAIAAVEKNKELDRIAAAAKTVEDARQKFLQTQYVGPARTTARLAALTNERPNGLQTNFQDLRSGHHAGPTPVSIITAQMQSRQILNILV
ncbi:MAG: hypothetical protein HRU33_19010 [Rhodobacteraceae bacterium]|nr:hypothetical protein [Paracoccaceae bacterium]